MRCEDKVLDVIRDLEAETRHEAIFLKLDLANLASVKRYAEEFLRYVYSVNFYFGRNVSSFLSPAIYFVYFQTRDEVALIIQQCVC